MISETVGDSVVCVRGIRISCDGLLGCGSWASAGDENATQDQQNRTYECDASVDTKLLVLGEGIVIVII